MNSIIDEDRPRLDDTPRDMSARQARPGQGPLDEIAGHWTALRGSRLLPLRSEIDPRGFQGALAHCFDLERIAPGTARFRVAGSRLDRLMGMTVRGTSTSSFLTETCQQVFDEVLDEVFETPATALILLSAETGSGSPPLRAWMNLLPVGNERGDTSRAIGALTTDGETASAHGRFSIRKIVLTPILSRDMTERTTRAWLAPN